MSTTKQRLALFKFSYGLGKVQRDHIHQFFSIVIHLPVDQKRDQKIPMEDALFNGADLRCPDCVELTKLIQDVQAVDVLEELVDSGTFDESAWIRCRKHEGFLLP